MPLVTVLCARMEDPSAPGLHDAVRRRGGRVIEVAGDRATAVLPAVSDAIEAAVEVQRVTAPGLPIAIHEGAAAERDGHLRGSAVIQCDRLCEAAHAGQILCSPAAAESAVDVEIVDLGEHRLHALARPDRVFQVTAQHFPPLRTVTVPHHNLPLAQTSFFGREEELLEVTDLMAPQRMVTLTGPGGSGKTRLAIELGAHWAHRFPGGVFFVDLAPVTDEDGVSSALARALGSSGDTAQHVRQAAVAALAPRRALLVIDNCEHLLEECTTLIDSLVSGCAELTIVATSREPLSAEYEQVFQVPPLGAAAVRLFEARAAAVRPGFSADEQTLATVTEICRRLDGLPLGIELAAARAAHLSPAEILSRLDDRFRLLSGARRRVGRHQTLRAAMDWSYDLLDDAHRALLRRLAVFSGPFTLAAVEGVCADELVPAGGVLDLVASLVAKSLVIAEVQAPETRYRLLETVRDYAAEQLADAGESEQMRSRHRDWYLRWAESLPTELSMMSDSAAELFERDWDNLRAALDWSLDQSNLHLVARLVVALSALWRTTIRVAESHRWMDPVVEAAGGFEPGLRVASLSLATYTAMMRVNPETLDLSRRATTAHSPASPWLAEAWALRGMLEGMLDPTAGAASDGFARALALAETLPPQHAAHVWIGTGLGFITIGRTQDAIDLFDRSLAVLSAYGDTYQNSVLIARSALACLYHLSGRHADALRVIRAAVTQLETRGWSGRPITGIGAVAAVLAGGGETERARALVRRDLVEGRNALPLSRSDDVLGLAVVAACEDDWAKASRLLAATVAAAREELFPFRSPYAAAVYSHYVSLAREKLGAERARSLRDEGRAMTAEEALAYGLMPSETSAGERPLLEREGNVWRLVYAGTTAHVKDSKGIRDLARLIAAAGDPIRAVDLAAAPISSAADMIDASARAAYRRRIAELEADIDDAERSNDIERVARLRVERHAIVDHVGRSMGLGGRPRRLGDVTESARKTVSARIKDAIAHIEEVHPALGTHLRSSVRTGTACVYSPNHAPACN